MKETILKIEGMNCMHCKLSVEKALKAVPGITAVTVDLVQKQAVVSGSADRGALTTAVLAAGFKTAG